MDLFNLTMKEKCYNEKLKYDRIRKSEKEHKFVREWKEYIKHINETIKNDTRSHIESLKEFLEGDDTKEVTWVLSKYKIENSKRILSLYIPLEQISGISPDTILPGTREVRIREVLQDVRVACELLNLNDEDKEYYISEIKEDIELFGFRKWELPKRDFFDF